MKNILLLIFLLTPMLLLAQEKPKYEKKIFVSPEGKLYVNKDLPIYLWLSTSPDEASKKYRLKSEKTKQYSNPMYLDADGFNSLRSPAAVDTVTRKTVIPEQDIVFEIYADAQKPNTLVDFGESVPYKQDGKSYIKSNTKLVLNAKDDISGLEAIFYSLDGEPYSKYTQAITFNQEKEYTLKYYAVDNVGNDEEIHELSLVYDNSAPVTKIIVSADEHENVISGRSKIELKSEDKGIGVNKIFYRIDSGNVFTYQYPINASNLAQGEHVISYYAVDKSGNKEAEQSYVCYIDKSAPTIIEEVIAKTFFANGKEYASGKAQLKLTAFDNKAGVKEVYYRINGEEYIKYEKPVFLSSSSGSLIIESYAVDNVNNKSQTQAANQKTTIPYIDLSGPTLKYSFTGPLFMARDTIFINSKTKITLKAADAEAGVGRIEYRIDSKESKEFSEPFSIDEEGIHSISYVGYDNVENTSSSSLTVKVDNTGPEVNFNFSIRPIGIENGVELYPKYVILFLSGTDNEVGLETIKYGYNEVAGTLYSIPLTGFAAGAKNVKIVASDKLGNTTEKTLKYIVKE